MNCLAPGFTNTGMVDKPETVRALNDSGIRVQSPDVVAMAAMHFASNKDVNGHTYAIIGGAYYELEEPLRAAMRSALGGATSNSERVYQGGAAFAAVEKIFGVDI